MFAPSSTASPSFLGLDFDKLAASARLQYVDANNDQAYSPYIAYSPRWDFTPFYRNWFDTRQDLNFGVNKIFNFDAGFQRVAFSGDTFGQTVWSFGVTTVIQRRFRDPAPGSWAAILVPSMTYVISPELNLSAGVALERRAFDSYLRLQSGGLAGRADRHARVRAARELVRLGRHGGASRPAGHRFPGRLRKELVEPAGRQLQRLASRRGHETGLEVLMTAQTYGGESSASSQTTQKLSLFALTMMVVGGMVGAGIFSLPRTFAGATGPIGALIAWLIAGTGMYMLARVFQSLAERKPDLDAGVFAYAKAGFGDYPGFLSAFGYWIGSCIGNVSYWVLIKSTLGAFFPVFGDGNTVVAIVVASVGIWLFHFMILRGTQQAALINSIVTVAKIVPIVIFILILFVAFKLDLFSVNLYGGDACTGQRLRAGARHHAGDRVRLPRHRGRQRLFALCREAL